VNLRRVAPADWAVGLCGAVLIGSLWLPWYHGLVAEGVYFNRSGGAPAIAGPIGELNAWQAMAVNDVILFIAGGLGISVLVASLTQSSGAIPIAASVFAALAGILASILAVVRLIWLPAAATDRAAGVWTGTAAALGLAVTGLLSMRDERRGAAGLAQVEVTRLPAPRGNGA
jgi:hypothetical protein